MDSIRKLLTRVPKKHRLQLLETLSCLDDVKCRSSLQPEKLAGTASYRIRSGRYRIIFHLQKNGRVIVEDIRLRNEGTYRDI